MVRVTVSDSEKEKSANNKVKRRQREHKYRVLENINTGEDRNLETPKEQVL